MSMPFDEAGNSELAAQIDNLGFRPDQLRDIKVASHGNDPVASSGQGFDSRLAIIHRDNLAAAKHEVRRLLGADRQTQGDYGE
jgi:hypothetical protein